MQKFVEHFMIIWHFTQFDTMSKNGQFDSADNLTPWVNTENLTQWRFAPGIFSSLVSNCPCCRIVRGVKLSAVSNCPVSNCPWCQSVCGVKLSWCQIVLVSNCPPTTSYLRGECRLEWEDESSKFTFKWEFLSLLSQQNANSQFC